MSFQPAVPNGEVKSLVQATLGDPLGSAWYVIYTMPRHEKQVAAQLNARAVENFLPLYEEMHRWKDRRVKVLLPLFPGYVFVRISLLERPKVLMVPGALRFVGFGGPPVSLDSKEVTRLRHGLSTLQAAPHPFLKIGQKVRVRSGPLTGAEGILQHHRDKFRVVLSMDLIQQSVAVEMNLEDLEVL